MVSLFGRTVTRLERLDEDLAGEVRDPDLRHEADHPGLEKILHLVGRLVGVPTEPGPLPVLGVRANDVAPLPAVTVSHIYYSFGGK